MPPSDLLPLLSYASLNCQGFVIQKISRVIRKFQHCVLWSQICFLKHRLYFVNNVNIFCSDLGDELNQVFDWLIFVLYACILQMNKNSLKKKYRIKDKYLSRRLFVISVQFDDFMSCEYVLAFFLRLNNAFPFQKLLTCNCSGLVSVIFFSLQSAVASWYNKITE